jgi:uncharacterized membrane protein
MSATEGKGSMLAESTTLNIAALALYFFIWAGYEILFDSRFRRPDSLNAKMVLVRNAWAARMLTRDTSLVDSNLVGHTIHTATFMASTTVLILAGLLGVLGSSDRIYSAVSSISMIIATDQRLFEWKIGLVIVIFVYTVFRFTWAIRQFNYFCAIIGSAPLGRADETHRHATAMAVVLGHAVASVNAGFRGYYFAFAAVGWIAHPLVLVLGALFTVTALVRRQLYSPVARAIRDYAGWLGGR